MKRSIINIITILTLLTLALAVAACDGGAAPSAENTPDAAATKAHGSYRALDYPSEIGVVDASGTRRLGAGELDGRAVSDLLEAQHDVMVFGRGGWQLRDTDFSEASISIYGGRIDYIAGDGTVHANIVGIMADAPERSISQLHHDVREALSGGERVLALFLDGWGLEKFYYHMDSAPFLASLDNIPALVAYPPITNVGLATVLSGVLPNVHGIHARADRMMREGVQDIFGWARDNGHSVAYIQGHTGIIHTSVTPLMSPDVDGKYGTDNEIFENAKRNLDVDFMFIHFQGIDDEGHTYGPYSPEVAARMALIDGYIEYLVENFGPAAVIITADHGMRDIEGNPFRLGDHLDISHEEMIVPYILFRSGR
ncbi:MAG: alkaline phosphatase family protein [Oscillospiraceae bacterium]|nr:alkaline phosphatase family protein [Oscillospiraceae bacterium]